VIDLLPSAEQRAIIDEAAALLASARRTGPGRELSGASFFASDLRARCGAQGWFTMALPEKLGGIGATVADQAVVFREAGRALGPVQLLGAVLAAHVAVELGESDLAARIGSGELSVGVGQLTRGPSGGMLFDPSASWSAVVSPAGDVVHLVEVAPGSVAPVSAIDPLTDVGRFATAALLRDALTLTGPVARSLVARTLVLAAAYQSGIAEAVRDMSVAYVKQRHQFGVPIGSFQAVKHRCAEMAVRAEAAWAQTAFAAVTAGVDGYDTGFEAAAAKYIATTSAVENARDNIQNHGAIGYTTEHEAHLYLGRAHLFDHLLGDTRAQLASMIPERTSTAARLELENADD